MASPTLGDQTKISHHCRFFLWVRLYPILLKGCLIIMKCRGGRGGVSGFARTHHRKLQTGLFFLHVTNLCQQGSVTCWGRRWGGSAESSALLYLYHRTTYHRWSTVRMCHKILYMTYMLSFPLLLSSESLSHRGPSFLDRSSFPFGKSS